MSTNRNRKKKPKNAKEHVTEPRPKRKSAPAGAETAQATKTNKRSRDAVLRSSAEDGSEGWLLALGAIAAAGTAYGVWKHNEAKKYAIAAEQADKRTEAHRAAEQTTLRHAQTMEANAAKERQRANLAEDRTREMEAIARKEHKRATLAENRASKLAMEVADLANNHIAKLLREAAPPLRFDGCTAAATDSVEIRINMDWILSGIVDPAEERGAIFGRIIGAVAHEWFHYNDTGRGKRPSHQEELLADKFAGKQLAKLGVPPNHFADLLRVFPESSTHPDGPRRAETMLNAWSSETQKREREAREPITTIVTQPVTETVRIVVQAPGRRPRNGAANKSAAKKKSTSKTGATKMNATNLAKTGIPKKHTAERSTPKKSAISASSNQ